MKIAANSQLPNCPISTKDIVATEAIFSPDIGALKKLLEKTIPVSNVQPIPIPEQ